MVIQLSFRRSHWMVKTSQVLHGNVTLLILLVLGFVVTAALNACYNIVIRCVTPVELAGARLREFRPKYCTETALLIPIVSLVFDSDCCTSQKVECVGRPLVAWCIHTVKGSSIFTFVGMSVSQK